MKSLPLRIAANAFLLSLVLLLPSAVSAGICKPDKTCDDPTAQRSCTTDADCPTVGKSVGKLENPLGTDATIPQLVGRAITLFTGISGSIALLMFVYGGVLWIFSGGAEERVTKGKEVMKWATIGLVVMFSAYALVNLVFKGIGAA